MKYTKQEFDKASEGYEDPVELLARIKVIELLDSQVSDIEIKDVSMYGGGYLIELEFIVTMELGESNELVDIIKESIEGWKDADFYNEMKLQLDAIEAKPTLEDIVEFFRKNGWTMDDMIEILLDMKDKETAKQAFGVAIEKTWDT